MPNHITNIVKVEGSPEKVEELFLNNENLKKIKDFWTSQSENRHLQEINEQPYVPRSSNKY